MVSTRALLLIRNRKRLGPHENPNGIEAKAQCVKTAPADLLAEDDLLSY